MALLVYYMFLFIDLPDGILWLEGNVGLRVFCWLARIAFLSLSKALFCVVLFITACYNMAFLLRICVRLFVVWPRLDP